MQKMNINITPNRLVKLIAGVSVFMMSACTSNEKKNSNSIANTAIFVSVANPTSNQQQSLNISGQIEAVQSANISTRIMGYITKMNVNIGDHVVKGQLLATISNDDILAKRAQTDAAIIEATAGLKNAQKDFERFTNLFQQQSASAKELENVTLQYNSAKSRLEVAKQMRNEVNVMLTYTNLTAPFNGTVAQKTLDVGSMANPGMPILTIEQSGTYQVSASVSESTINQIHLGSAAIINVSAVDKTFNGTISQINQSSQFTGGQYLIKISVPEKEKNRLYAGMYANITIPVKKNMNNNTGDDQVLVPMSSIEHKDQLTGIYTIGNNNTALLRWVRLGKTKGNQVEVLSGLSLNEQFITNAEGRLYNGVSIKIK